MAFNVVRSTFNAPPHSHLTNGEDEAI